MAISKFRRGSSTFTCNVCKRLTRDTGAQSFGNHICPQCFDLSGIENDISDGNATVDEYRPTIERLVGELVAKGVDVTEWKTTFNPLTRNRRPSSRPLETPMTKMTREEKRAADAAAARSARIAEFKKSFARSTGRRVYTDATAWAAEESGDRSGQALYELVHDFTRVKAQLAREVNACAEALADIQARIAAGRDAMMWSNGICGRYGSDIDKYHVTVETLRKAIAVTAIATGWRVREIEADVETTANDMHALLDVVAGPNRFWIRKTDAVATFFNGTEFVADDTAAFDYLTEDDAYAALAVIVTGRSL